MENQGLVPLFFDENPQNCEQIIESCYLGGAKILEFTARGKNAPTIFETFFQKIKIKFPDLIMGVGSLVCATEAVNYIQAGADFIVTPVFRKDINETCNLKKVPYIPGCSTLTEISIAEQSGCEFVKLFPASIYGPEFIKAILGPHPWTKIMATGGITMDEKDLNRWFSNGASCVGIGSNLIKRNSSKDYDQDFITTAVRQVLTNITRIRNKTGNI